MGAVRYTGSPDLDLLRGLLNRIDKIFPMRTEEL